jgi:methionyl-tRNA synthetase
MIHRNFEGVVPETGELAPESRAILLEVEGTFEAVGKEFEACHFRGGLQEALRLAQAANKYLDERAPWKAVKEDKAHAAETLATALNVINALKLLLHPVLPFSTTQLHGDLAFEGDIVDEGWEPKPVPAGTKLPPARPLYTKIEPALAGATA